MATTDQRRLPMRYLAVVFSTMSVVLTTHLSAYAQSSPGQTDTNQLLAIQTVPRQTDKAQTDKAQTDKAQADKGQAAKAETAKVLSPGAPTVNVETLIAQSDIAATNDTGPDEKPAVNQDSYFDAKGYRRQRYRAPLPQSVPGGQVVRTDEVLAFIQQHQPALIDVLSVTLRTEAIDFGISWLPDSSRENIPGSIWLPNVGRADLEPFMLRFFTDHLNEISDNDKAYPILFYCIADCWMSWNAVKRAAELGYTNLYWFPEGTDGWLASGGEVVTAEPEPIIDYLRELEPE